MLKITINDRLSMSCPEDMQILSPEEKRELDFLEVGPGECLRNQEKHILISISWKQLRGLGGSILATGDIAGGSEKQIRKAMTQYGYHMDGRISRRIGDINADGFEYTYTADGVEMFGETLVTKDRRTVYYVHFYSRQEGKEENLEVLDYMLRTARWV